MSAVVGQLLDRPLVGDTTVDFRAMVGAVDRVAEAVVEQRGRGGGAFLLSFQPEQEAAVALVLRLIEREIRRRSRERVALVSPLVSSEAFAGAPFVLYHHAPRVPGAEQAIGRLVARGTVIVATGAVEEIERFEPESPWRWLDLGLALPVGVPDLAGADGAAAALVPWAACLDLWGCPGPVELLAEAAGLDDAEAAAAVEACGARGPLFWAEVRAPAALLVSVGGGALAARLVEREKLGPEELWKRYESLICAAVPEETPDRLTVLRLFRAWLAAPAARHRWLGDHGRLPNLRRVVADAGPRFAGAARRPGEGLAWISLLRDYGLFDHALAVATQAAERWPEDARFAHARVEVLARAAAAEPSRFRQAVEAWVRLPAEIRRDPYFLVQWALLSARVGETGRAADTLDGVLREHPDSVVARVARADLALDLGEFERADTEVSAALDVDPENVPALHVLARVRAAQGNWAEAERVLQDLLARHPLNVHAHHYRGEIEAARGNREAARGHFGAVLRIDPENVAALHSLADLAYREAREAMERGGADEARRALEEALGYLDQAGGAEPANPRVRLLALLCRAWAGAAGSGGADLDAAEAIRALDAWIEQTPKDVRLLHARGQVEEAAGRDDEARAWYEAVLRIDGRNLHALASLADLALRRGDTEAAGRWLAAHEAALEVRALRLPAAERDAWTRWLDDRKRRLTGAPPS